MKKSILKVCAVLTIAGAATLMNAEFPAMAAVSTYAETGVIDTSCNGLIYNSDTKEWNYYEDGVLAKKTLMAYCNGKFWYVKDGRLDKSFTGIYMYNGKSYYFANGCLQNDGKAHFVNLNGKTYFIENGVWDKWSCGMKYGDGSWKYVENGLVSTYETNAFWDNTWWHLDKGNLCENYTGIQTIDGAKLFFKNGKWSKTSGIYKVSSVEYYYVTNGKVDTSVTGLKYYDGEWLYFRNGEFDYYYTGLVYHNNDWWYVSWGKLNKGYNTWFDFNGKLWKIKDGKMVKGIDLSNINKNVPAKVVIQEGVTELTSEMFAGTDVEEVVLPSSVKYIRKNCFRDCKKLTKINLENVSFIEDEAFSGCDRLTEATYYAGKYYGYGVYSNCKNLKKVNFENGITSIPGGALSFDTGVTSVVVPASVKEIGYYSFENYYGQVTCLGVKHGLVYENSTKSWVYYRNNQVNKSAALVACNGELWYVYNGTIDKSKEGIFEYNCRRYYIKDGKVDRSFTGLSEIGSSQAYYVINGCVDTSVNGLVEYEGKLYKIRNGKIDYFYDGTVKHNNEIYYVADGAVSKRTAVYEYNGEKYQFVDGKVATGYTGVSRDTSMPGNIGTYWIKNGKVDTTVNGIRYDANATIPVRYYFKNGMADTSYNGLVYDDGVWRYVYSGYCTSTYEGFATYNNKEWYVKSGKLKKVTGMVVVDGVNYYVKDGYLETGMNGLKYVDGTWYYFNKGVVDANYRGLAYANNAWWYVKDGMLDKTYSGNVSYNGKVYKVVNGKVA